jgi:hypothetical protein
MKLGKGSWKSQKAEAAKILTNKNRLAASNGRIDDVARILRHEGREAAERRAEEIHQDPGYAI